MAHTEAHRISRNALLFAFALGFSLSLGTFAARADCVTRPLCAPPVPTPVPSDPVNQVSTAVGGAAAQAKQAAGDPANKITGTVNGILHRGAGGDPGGHGGPGGTEPGHKDKTGGSSVGGSSATGVSGAQVPAGPRVSSFGPSSHRGLLHRIGGAIGQLAGPLGFPIVLAALMMAFAIVQDRLDRKDPKLALAPLEPDILTFQ